MTVAAFVLALALVATGATMIYPPAGFITAGLLLAACAALFERGGE